MSIDKQKIHSSETDNAAGMAEATVGKLNRGIFFTNGKEHGQGLGMAQVQDMLNANEMEMIASLRRGQGVTVELIFLKFEQANQYKPPESLE